MSLADVMKGKFRADIRLRGAALLEAGRVTITRVTSTDVFALVADGEEHQVHLHNTSQDLEFHCSSVEGTKRPSSTKYVWASILAVDEQKLLSSHPRAGAIPAFISQMDSLETILAEDDEEFDEESFVINLTRSAATPAATVAPKRTLPEWQKTLFALKDELTNPFTGSADAPEIQVLYQLDIEASWKARQLVLHVSQQKRRARGGWGVAKPLKLKGGRVASNIGEAIDQEILAGLIGGISMAGGETATGTAGEPSMSARFRLNHDLAIKILPILCDTGRLSLILPEEEQEEEAATTTTKKRKSTRQPQLVYDAERQWDLVISVEEQDEQWAVVGSVTCGQVSLEIDEPSLMVPGGLLIHDNAIMLLNDYDAFDWIATLRENDGLSVPVSEGTALVDTLLSIPVIPKLELPRQLKLDEVVVEPTATLRLISPRRNARLSPGRFSGQVEFSYAEHAVRASAHTWGIVERSNNRCYLRDRDKEEEFFEELIDNGFRRSGDAQRLHADVEIPASEMPIAVRKLMETERWTIEADGSSVREARKLKFRVTSGIDWFDLSADVDFDGHTIAFPDLLAALARGDRTVRLDDGSMGIVPEEWIRQYGLLAGLGQVEDDALRFSSSQATLVDAFLSAKEDVEYDEKFLGLKQQLEVMADDETLGQPPKDFHGELRHYQQEGLSWLKMLQACHLGGCLADDMGLGKTVQVLALMAERFQQPKEQQRPNLVVVPKSLMFNWVAEVEKFAPHLKVLEYSGVNRAELREEFTNVNLIVTTYGMLRRDILSLKNVEFDYVVLDEAQTIKNANSQVAKAARLLNAQHRIALSGTPIENHLGDLWSIFEFLNPSLLGRSSLFKSVVVNQAEDETVDRISRGLRPFILRRTKGQVASELPAKFEETLFCEMGAEQRRRYEELQTHYRDSLLGVVEKNGLGQSQMHILEALLRLRQAACHPGLLDDSLVDEQSAKFDVLIPYLEELREGGHKALVFSQFTSLLGIVKRHLDRAGMKYAYLDGKTRKRKQIVEEFQESDETSVFLISLKAGGLGLNLTAADYVFLLDPWWNPAVEAQAIDRAHRVGQSRQVFAYRMICKNSIEEKVAELQKRKRELADTILETNQGLPFKDMTMDDLHELLS